MLKKIGLRADTLRLMAALYTVVSSGMAPYTAVHRLDPPYISQVIAFSGSEQEEGMAVGMLLVTVLPASAGTLIQRNGGICHMKDLLIKLSVMVAVWKEENGQDLIEYALLVAFVAFAATAGMKILATDINAAFTTIGTDLTNAIS